MTAETKNLAAMTDQQLEQFLFHTPTHRSFIDETAHYMAEISQTEEVSIQQTNRALSTETDLQNSITKSTESLNQSMVADMKKAAELQPASSLPSWLGYVLDAVSVLMSVATLNPFIIGMATTNLVLDVSGAKQKLMDACGCGSDPNKRAEFEAGFAAGEALVCSVGSVSGDMMMASAAEKAAAAGEEVGAAAAANAARTSLQRAGDFSKYLVSYWLQGAMMDNFWGDFFKGRNMSDNNAILAGMAVGIVGGIIGGIAASSNEGGCTQILLGPTGLERMRYLTVALSLMRDGFQMGVGIETMKIGKQYVKLAEYMKQAMAPMMSQVALNRNLLAGVSSILSQTQETLKEVAKDAAANNQTFSSFGQMFRSA